MSKKKVLTGAERKAQLLEAGAKLAAKHGAANVTRRMVAAECGCAEGLVSVYMGTAEAAQKAYARKAKAMGLELPDKAKSDAIGIKLRAHGPRDKRDSRKRSAKEVKAIKNKRVAQSPVRPSTKPQYVPQRAPSPPATKPAQAPGKAPTQPERKSAARAPKAPPPVPVDNAELPLPSNAPQAIFP